MLSFKVPILRTLPPQLDCALVALGDPPPFVVKFAELCLRNQLRGGDNSEGKVQGQGRGRDEA